MKEIIKITIALAFIIGAYLLGHHQEEEKNSTKLDELKAAILAEEQINTQLKDSIDKLKYTADSLKNKIEIITSQKVKRQKQSVK